jgi:hypothetical protein
VRKKLAAFLLHTNKVMENGKMCKCANGKICKFENLKMEYTRSRQDLKAKFFGSWFCVRRIPRCLVAFLPLCLYAFTPLRLYAFLPLCLVAFSYTLDHQNNKQTIEQL